MKWLKRTIRYGSVIIAALVWGVAVLTPVDGIGVPVNAQTSNDGVMAADVRAGASPPMAANGAIYLTIQNAGDRAARLVSAETDVAAAVELHETVNDNGVMRMIPRPKGYAIAADETLVLEPGGKHIMLLGLEEPLRAGDAFSLTLNFADAESMVVTVPVLPLSEVAMDHNDTDQDAMSMDDIPADEDAVSETADDALTEDTVTVQNVRAGASPPMAANGAIYLTIQNAGDRAARLVSAETDVAAAVELHETVNDNGVMRMIPRPEGYAIAADETLVLEPGGKHIMLLGLEEPLRAGDAFSLTLNLADAESMVVTVPVLPLSEVAMDHSEMDQGEMDHGEMAGDDAAMTDAHMADDAEMTDRPQWARMVEERLDVSALHHIDEMLNDEGAMEPEFADTAHAFNAQLSKIPWPEEMFEVVANLNRTLTNLETALYAGDAETAAPLAAAVHEIAHDMEHLMSALLDDGEHSEQGGE